MNSVIDPDKKYNQDHWSVLETRSCVYVSWG